MLKESGAIERAYKDFRKDEVGHTGIMVQYVIREVLLRERERERDAPYRITTHTLQTKFRLLYL